MRISKELSRGISKALVFSMCASALFTPVSLKAATADDVSKVVAPSAGKFVRVNFGSYTTSSLSRTSNRVKDIYSSGSNMGAVAEYTKNGVNGTVYKYSYDGRNYKLAISSSSDIDACFSYSSIPWKVVEVENGVATLISDKIIDVKNYDSTSASDTSAAEIIQFLNSSFYDEAFNDNEKNIIKDSDRVNVSLATVEDMQNEAYGLTTDAVRKLSTTPYVTLLNGSSSCAWWLLNKNGNNAAVVEANGALNTEGKAVTESIGVVPKIKIDLVANPSLWNIIADIAPVVTPAPATKSAVSTQTAAYLSIGKSTVSGVKAKSVYVKKKGIQYQSAVKLSWNKNQYADGYVISRATGKSSKYSKLKEVSASNKDTQSFTDKKVKKGTKYTYQITAFAYDTNKVEYKAVPTSGDAVTVSKKVMKPVIKMKKKGNNLTLTFKKVEGTTYNTEYKYNDEKKWHKLNKYNGKIKKKIKMVIYAHGFKLRVRTTLKDGKKKYNSPYYTSKSL